VLPCSLDDDRTRIFNGCLLKKVYQRVDKGSCCLKMVTMGQAGRFVVLTRFRDAQGCECHLFCNCESSFSDFLGLATPE
jgi:hypothetical protein